VRACVRVCVCDARGERMFFSPQFRKSVCLHSVHMLHPTVFKFQDVLQCALFSIYLNWVPVLENDAVYRSEQLLTFVSGLVTVLW
jgi:hypothetical protein